MKKERIKRYSEAFKHQVVREYEAGTIARWLMQKYGIGGDSTIKRWVHQYGREGFRTKQVQIQTAADQVEFQEMKARIAELESALAQATLDNRMLAATLEAAEAGLGVNSQKNFKKQS